MFSAAIPGLVYRKEDDSTDAAYKKYMNGNAIEETSTLSGFTSQQQNRAIIRFIPSAVSVKQLLPHMLAGHFELDGDQDLACFYDKTQQRQNFEQMLQHYSQDQAIDSELVAGVEPAVMNWSDLMSEKNRKLAGLVTYANTQNCAGLSVKDARVQYGDIHNLNWPGREGDRELEVISSDHGVICMACAPGSIFDFMAQG
jgi:hypothetical protein